MPLSITDWRKEVPDADTFRQRVLSLLGRPVPWASEKSAERLRGELQVLFGDLQTYCFSKDPDGFRGRLARFVNFWLLIDVNDDPPAAYTAAQNVLKWGGLVPDNPKYSADHITGRFYLYAKPRESWEELAGQVFKVYFH